MVSFQSDNTTGSAWVSSRRRFSLPRNSESLESPFLAGDYAKADKRRKKREKRRAREQARRAPHAAQPAQPASLGPRSSAQQKSSVSSPHTVGRLVGVTTCTNTSFFASADRSLKNFSNDRLTSSWKNTIPNSSGFLLDGVELTKEEYKAWMEGDPEANRNVVVQETTPDSPTKPATH
ncbi:hypothetical protein CT171_07675 [Trueperella pyogenes]|uniref:hypothetical protein n=1 Tax=Trueperella pyogenes TaxID=1661 RepID=UPI000C1B6AD3|nr:hypothetical protein [Trueperella pyogenes]PIN51551.1 hypothetical protein CT171_07675 [Trueperella pyogenes]